MKQIISCLAAILLASLHPIISSATTIHVPSEQPTIQLGIEATAPGDTVLIASGTYSDCTYEAWCSSHGGGPRRVCFAMVDSIHVIGNVDDPGSVIVDAGQSGGVIFSEDAHGASIEGLTISGGSTTDIWNGSGGGLFIYISSLQIRHCIFSDNTSPDHGGGVQCADSTVDFDYCVFQNNTANTSGGGIYATYSNSSFTGCDFVNNSADGGFSEYGGGGGIYIDSSQLTVSECSFTGNTAANRNGGALVCYTSTSGIIQGTSFIDNSSRRGGALMCRWESSPTFLNCTITGNSSTESGGGISCLQTAHPHFQFSDILENTSPLGPDGNIPTDCSVDLHCCDIDLSQWEGDGLVTVSDYGCNSSADVLMFTDFTDGAMPESMRIEFGDGTPEDGYFNWLSNTRIQFGDPEWQNYTVRLGIQYHEVGSTLFVHWDKEHDGTDDSLSYRLRYEQGSDSAYLEDFDGDPNQHHFNVLDLTTAPDAQVNQVYICYAQADNSGVSAGIEGVFGLSSSHSLYRSGYAAIQCTKDARIEWIEVIGEYLSQLAAPILDIIEVPPEYRVLVWENPADPEFVETCIYRGIEPGFSLGDPLLCTTSESFLETDLHQYYYVIRYRDIDGRWSAPSNEVASQYPTPVSDVPHQVALGPIFPNPFNPSTTIQFNLVHACHVTISVYSLDGRLMSTLSDNELRSGLHSVNWNGTDNSGRPLASGIYLCRLDAGGIEMTKRMALIR